MTTNLSVRVGDLELPYPVIPASGVWPYAKDFWSGEKLDGIGALCTKAISMEPRGGNGGVRIWETPSGVLNSIGLQNCGVREFAGEYAELVKRCPVPVIANVVMERPAETRETLRVLSEVEGVAAAELNISCPNADGDGMAWGMCAEQAAEVEALMQLILDFFASEIDEQDEKNVRITILGDKDALPPRQRDVLREAERRTLENTGLKLNIALNYGGHKSEAKRS